MGGSQPGRTTFVIIVNSGTSRSFQSHFACSSIAESQQSLLSDCKSYFDAALKTSSSIPEVRKTGVDELLLGEQFHPEQIYGQLAIIGRGCFSVGPRPSFRLKTKRVRWTKVDEGGETKKIAENDDKLRPVKSILKNKEAVKAEIFNQNDMESFANELGDDLDEMYEQSESEEEDEYRFEDFFTSHQVEEMKIEKRVAEIEREMVDGEKPWQMKGEIEAKDRPADSALEQYLEFDRQTKVPVAITAELTERIESVVKRRIKDRVFDDVERKVKPEIEHRSSVKLEFEKSTKGLGDLYADSYSKALGGSKEDEVDAEQKKRDEIKESMRVLFEKLDILSHSTFTPMPAKLKTRTVTNFPSIRMEEVAPVAVANTLKEKPMLAPEEISERTRNLETKEDMDDDEKKKLKRKMKQVAKKRKRSKVDEKKSKKSKNFEEEMVIKKAERLLHKTPNMRIAEKEMAKPRKRKLLA